MGQYGWGVIREWAVTSIMVLINMVETFIRGDGYADCLWCAYIAVLLFLL
jgi:hypothetical protein